MDFDDIIEKTLGAGTAKSIVQGTYQVPVQWPWTLTIDKKDEKSFKELFKQKGGNSGIGNGEVSLYWLFNYKSAQRKKTRPDPKRAFEARGGDAADLKIDGLAVEVKSYPRHSQMTLGKFKDDKDSLELFSYLFSFVNLFIKFGAMDSSGQRVRAFKSVLTFKIDDVMQGLSYYDVLYEVFTTKKIQDKIAALETAGLGSTQQAKRAAMAKTKELSSFAKQLKDLKIISKMPSKGSGFTDTILKRKNLAAKIVGYFLKTKLDKKPGDKGYMVNLLTTDATNIHFHFVDLKKMNLTYSTLEQGFNVGSGEIQITKAEDIFK